MTGELLFYIVGGLVGAYVCIFLQTIIHETGHLIFGLLSGYQFRSFRIFNFMWLKEEGTLKLRKMSIVGTSGQCLMVPPELKDGKIPIMLYNFGGVILNVISSVISLVIAIITFESRWSLFGFLMAVEGIILAFLNGIPLKLSGLSNDGYNAFSIKKNEGAMRTFWAQMTINDQQTRGVRLKDMPEELFEVPSDQLMKNGIISTIGVFACNRLMDMKKFKEAESLMKHLLEIDSGILGIYRNLMTMDRIYIELIGENRGDVLEGLYTNDLKKFQVQMKDFPAVIRTKYAYTLLSEKNITEAQKIKAQFEKVAKTYPYPSDIQSEREFLEIVENCNW